MIQSLQCIVDVCSPVEAFRAQNKATPAHDAAGTGHLESLIFLIENTACTAHDRDKNQATPLHWAAQLGHTEVVDWLISDAGAQPDVKNTAGIGMITYIVILLYCYLMQLYQLNSAAVFYSFSSVMSKKSYTFRLYIYPQTIKNALS